MCVCVGCDPPFVYGVYGTQLPSSSLPFFKTLFLDGQKADASCSQHSCAAHLTARESRTDGCYMLRQAGQMRKAAVLLVVASALLLAAAPTSQGAPCRTNAHCTVARDG